MDSSYFLLFLLSTTYANYGFDEYYNMIVDNITYSQQYVVPQDNSELVNVTDSVIYDYGTYDFIIVGGGSAGAVLASRLSEINQWNVLLLEAGGNDSDFSIIPAMWNYLWNSDMNWAFSTTPQTSLCLGYGTGNRCLHHAGKVIGGSSSINALIYNRGNALNFDQWAELGNPGWSYEEVLPYFKKSENAAAGVGEDGFHGVGGPLSVDYTSETPELLPALFEAFAELGVHNIDYNGKRQLGVGSTQFTINYNKRASTARAFLDPVLRRANLAVSLRSFVTKILINDFSKSAYGVEFVKGGKRFISKARKEVILSAGVMSSPQILMLSGIGPKDHLNELGINVVKSLPVGIGLQDQVMYTVLKFKTNRTYFNVSFKEQLQLYLQNKRPLTATGLTDILAFVNPEETTPTLPEIEIMMGVTAPTLNDSISPDLEVLHDINVVVCLLNPISQGTLRLQSNSPIDRPLVDPNYLNDPNGRDISTLLKGMKYIFKLNETKTFQEYRAWVEHPPAEPCDGQFERYSDDWWYCAIKNFGSATYHSMGTTRMGNSTNSSVVDSRLKVHGIKSLRVVDAGIMPVIVSGHTNAPTIMIAEKTADLIKQDYGLPTS
ncbi:glucose dehydrogenase [FAD, quinone]-like [Cylas formicarius]|uniref:glucose dehydrogenase [FAD, quinone]-like n=1 Tax=Cylas formicarius TaxID=197179 RepID=UPI00295886BF|nr:glucose dehydrogenase [FAD, quinone]-like [Cylas formicarius]